MTKVSGPRAKARQKLAHLKLSKFSRLCGALPSGRLSCAPIRPPSSAPHNIQQKKSLKKNLNFESKLQTSKDPTDLSNRYLIFQRISGERCDHVDGCDNFY